MLAQLQNKLESALFKPNKLKRDTWAEETAGQNEKKKAGAGGMSQYHSWCLHRVYFPVKMPVLQPGLSSTLVLVVIGVSSQKGLSVGFNCSHRSTPWLYRIPESSAWYETVCSSGTRSAPSSPGKWDPGVTEVRTSLVSSFLRCL